MSIFSENYISLKEENLFHQRPAQILPLLRRNTMPCVITPWGLQWEQDFGSPGGT